MKILLLCNVPTAVVSRDMGLPVTVFGGWIEGAITQLRKGKNLELSICCPLAGIDAVISGCVDGMAYYCFPQAAATDTRSDSQAAGCMKQIISAVNPDILHIFGSEFAHAYIMAKLFDHPERTMVHIQGLCSECSKYYFYGLPRTTIACPTLADIYVGDTLKQQQKQFIRRGQIEIDLLKYVKHVTGRTSWDRTYAIQINPNVSYHFCNETLREVFYSNEWTYERCQSHTIFASSASYPIKGFHWLLKAFPHILSRYPDAILYVAGKSPFDIPWYKQSAYNRYLMKLITSSKLSDKVVFCGTLDEKQMKERYLLANVFILSSSIENSPNSLGEAMLLGVPCVASRVGGVPDMLIDQEEGYTYTYDDSDMLAQHVCDVFADSVKASEIAKRGRAHAMKNYSREDNRQTLIDIYSDIYTDSY